MTAKARKICAVITADDFGSSSSVNAAVAEAHDNGVLTAASIMAGGAAFDEAVEIAKKRSGLSLGLHVTLCDGKAVLPPSEIPDLADAEGSFEKNPARAWVHYLSPRVRMQIDREIAAQFDRLEEAGLRIFHVDSHHHLHMHPEIFSLVCRHACSRNVPWVRIPGEPFGFMLRNRNPGRGVLPFLEWGVFRALRGRNHAIAAKYGRRVLLRSYGLCRTGMIDHQFFLRVFDEATGPLELFAHPDRATEEGMQELDVLTSELIGVLGRGRVRLVGYESRELLQQWSAFTGRGNEKKRKEAPYEDDRCGRVRSFMRGHR